MCHEQVLRSASLFFLASFDVNLSMADKQLRQCHENHYALCSDVFVQYIR